MTPAERLAAKALGEHDALTFMRVWFQLMQGEKLKINWHHHYFNLIFKRIVTREIQNAIINVAPGSTKTEFFSIHAPAYCMAVMDKVRILNTSYSKDLVNENSERTRSIIKSSEWQELYGHDIGKDKIDDWTINGDDGKRLHQMFSRPSGGQITGVRGGYMTAEKFSGYLMLDDWQKPEDLFSEPKRNASNRRVSNTLRSRRADYMTPIISIQQRLHTEDVTNFLLNGGLGMDFEQVKIPALVNEDYIDSLPQEMRDRCWHDLKDTKSIRGYWSFFPQKESVDDLFALWDSDPYTFMSQYMQEPESLSGGVFDADAFLFWSEDESDGVLPKPFKYDYRFITADTAQKAKTHNDFTVFAHWGYFGGKIYLLDMIRGKFEAPELRSKALSLINQAWAQNEDTTMGVLRSVFIEDKSSGTGLIQELANKTPIRVTPVPRGTDKFTRAMDVQAPQRGGCVVLPYGAAFNNEFIAEVASFTHDDTHKHDDQTDVMMDAIEQAIIKPNIGGNEVIMFGGRRRSRR
ncbi:MAG: phage terminase large subunit [Marinomonas gallaica]